MLYIYEEGVLLKFLGYISFIHIIIIVGWMVYNIIFSIQNPFLIHDSGMSISQKGLEYHSSMLATWL